MGSACSREDVVGKDAAFGGKNNAYGASEFPKTGQASESRGTAVTSDGAPAPAFNATPINYAEELNDVDTEGGNILAQSRHPLRLTLSFHGSIHERVASPSRCAAQLMSNTCIRACCELESFCFGRLLTSQVAMLLMVTRSCISNVKSKTGG